MKQKKLLAFTFIFSAILSVAQENLDCNSNIGKAIRYINYYNESPSQKSDSDRIFELLKPCVDSEEAQAQYLMAKFILLTEDESNYRKAFRLMRKAANQDVPEAANDLGLLFKYAHGVDQNLFKAARWFRKGYNLGNSEAAYNLGYMFLKGFGGETQDYNKAVRWFKKSEESMAQHWLAVCYYFGYGVSQDISKAKQLLADNDIQKSKTLLKSLEKYQQENQLSELERSILEYTSQDESLNTQPNELLGAWSGDLIQYDWSEKMVMRRIPVELKFSTDSISGKVISELVVDKMNSESELLVYSNEMVLDDLFIDIGHPYSSVADDIQLYDISNSKINLKTIDNEKYLLFNSTSFIRKWKEPGPPLLFLLKKEKNLTANNVEVSNEVIEELQSQSDFIKLYPNPVVNDLVIAYEISQVSDVQVSVTSIDGLHSYQVKQNIQQLPGLYMYYFNSSVLQKGIYVVNITASGERHTKTIIKN